jgi:alpha-beta hydrolase superfamily lysophospholipase
MGLIMEQGGPGGPAEGYENVPVTVVNAAGEPQGRGPAVLRRRSARPSRRAVMYVHCLSDSFVPADLAGWYTDRAFHFYAADLRAVGTGDGRTAQDAGRAASELGECFACLDAAAAHLRAADAIETLVVCAHAAGAVVAALWCHARRGSRPIDALILTSPDLGAGQPGWAARRWLARAKTAGEGGTSPLLAGAQRRLRRGLDIACPVLVMCPPGDRDAPGGAPLPLRMLAGGRVTIQLGEHVTWLTLDGGLPGQVPSAGPGRRRLFDEISRWLSAYLSAEIRDQLL